MIPITRNIDRMYVSMKYKQMLEHDLKILKKMSWQGLILAPVIFFIVLAVSKNIELSIILILVFILASATAYFDFYFLKKYYMKLYKVNPNV